MTSLGDKGRFVDAHRNLLFIVDVTAKQDMDTTMSDHNYCVPNNVDTQVEYFIATRLEIPLEKPDGTAVDFPTDFRQSKSNKICCVPECHTTGYDEIPGHGKPSYHSFPAATNPLRSVWLNKIKRDEGPHFK
ncbi:uncharacterized protein LOC132759025, partial [Ruditapes philippinarum]|uniref:uncharacterized protein LOC132759025 n=1 Tax=Ruditapes philippinarum TaxID=129788 RepID=UPI00295B2B4D